MKNQVDIAIIGGGLVGFTAALSLLLKGYKIALIEPMQKKLKAWERVIALNLFSKNYYATLGVWEEFKEQSFYLGMQINDHHSNESLNIHAEQFGIGALGYMACADSLVALLQKKCDEHPFFQYIEASCENFSESPEGVAILLETAEVVWAKAVIGADGANSRVREWCGIHCESSSYERVAVVTRLALCYPHHKIARQVFLGNGPVALLPLQNSHEVSLVWSGKSVDAGRFKAAPDYLARSLEKVFPELGPMQVASPVKSFPLKAHLAKSFAFKRFALVGDSAHVVHPLAGLGANFGIQDTEYLSRVLDGSKRFCYEKRFLTYGRQRRLEFLPAYFLVNKIAHAFSNDAGFARQFGRKSIKIASQSDFFKHVLFKGAQFELSI